MTKGKSISISFSSFQIKVRGLFSFCTSFRSVEIRYQPNVQNIKTQIGSKTTASWQIKEAWYNSLAYLKHKMTNMPRILSTNLVDRKISVQADLKIDLSKLQHYFFSRESWEAIRCKSGTEEPKRGPWGGQSEIEIVIEDCFFHFYW